MRQEADHAERPTADWIVGTLLERCPRAGELLTRKGMACRGCVMAPFETLVEAAEAYEIDAETLIREIRAIYHTKVGETK